MLSARGVDKAPDNAMFRSEQALAATGLPSVVVRPSWFAQNFTEGADRRREEGLPGVDERVRPFAGRRDDRAVATTSKLWLLPA